MVNIGVDLHKTQFTVCLRTGKSEDFTEYPTTEEGYLSFFARLSELEERVRIGVESTGNTRYFKNRAEEAGAEVVVVNTLKFKVVNESVKKTDKNDAAVIARFLEKDMLPASRLCSRSSEEIKRLLKVRAAIVRSIVVIKNQIRALLVGLGVENANVSLRSRSGRTRILAVLQDKSFSSCELTIRPLFDALEQLDENVGRIEEKLERLTECDRMVELLRTIPGCGKINAWTIRAYTDDINRFASAQKYAAYSGMIPRVQNSNETVRHGRITKRGPEELRTAYVQIVISMRRMAKTTGNWRIMRRYEKLKTGKGSGKSIIATARKLAVIVWHMLSKNEPFKPELMS